MQDGWSDKDRGKMAEGKDRVWMKDGDIREWIAIG